MTTPNAFPSRANVETAFAGAYTHLGTLKDQGGQGMVFRATASDGSDVALKVYNPDQVEERNEREVAALRKLKGATITTLHDAGTVVIGLETYRFLATAFVEGSSLKDLIASGPISAQNCARIARDVALAIDELWSMNIVHRDVKPPNILVKPNGGAVLIDLGVARHLDQKTITSVGYTFGTPGYFAPEHIGGARVTCKADIFALGIVMQEMLLGRHPTNRNQKLLLDGGPKTSNILPKVPRPLAALIDAMVAREPIDRPMPRNVAKTLETVF